MKRNSEKKNIKWLLVGILMFCFTIIAIFMVTEKIHAYDKFVYSIISKWISPIMTKVVTCITHFASPITIVVFSLIISYVIGIKKKDRKTAILFCLNLVIIALLNFLLKNLFARTRPELINIITESGYSFPSGHSSIAVAFYGYIIYLINTKCDNKKVKVLTTIGLVLLILLIGLSRVYLGVHYASDVTAAFMFATSYLIIYTHIVNTLDKK